MVPENEINAGIEDEGRLAEDAAEEVEYLGKAPWTLKKIMTDLAAGHITQKEADRLIKPKKVAEDKSMGEIEVEEERGTKKTQKRRTKSLGGKK